jgi:hypothetical protein
MVLGCGLGPFFLPPRQIFDGALQQSLSVGDFCLFGRDLKLKFLKIKRRVLGPDNFPIKVISMKTPEKYLDSKIRKFSSKLDVVVGFPAMLAAERAQEQFSEEWNID